MQKVVLLRRFFSPIKLYIQHMHNTRCEVRQLAGALSRETLEELPATLTHLALPNKPEDLDLIHGDELPLVQSVFQLKQVHWTAYGQK